MSEIDNRSHTDNRVARVPDQNTRKTLVLPETLWANDPDLTGIPPQGTAVITIAQQFGSGGIEIARQIAQMNGMQYLNQDIVAEAARQMGMSTQASPQRSTPANSMVAHIIDILQTSNPLNVSQMLSPATLQHQSKELAYLQLTQKIILEMATQGNAVIVGRGSQFLLHHAARTLHVSIFAPHADRITNVMNQFHLNHTVARQLITRRDYEQESYLRQFYGADGRQPALYHLLLNTGLFSSAQVISIIHQILPMIKENA